MLEDLRHGAESGFSSYPAEAVLDQPTASQSLDM